MKKDHLLKFFSYRILASKRYLVAGECERGTEVMHSCNTGCQGLVVHTQEYTWPRKGENNVYKTCNVLQAG